MFSSLFNIKCKTHTCIRSSLLSFVILTLLADKPFYGRWRVRVAIFEALQLMFNVFAIAMAFSTLQTEHGSAAFI